MEKLIKDYIDQQNAYNAKLAGATFTGNIEVIRSDLASVKVTNAHADSWRGAWWHSRRARGTAAAPTIVSDGDTLYAEDIYAHNGSGYVRVGQITCTVDGAPASTIAGKFNIRPYNSAGGAVIAATFSSTGIDFLKPLTVASIDITGESWKTPTFPGSGWTQLNSVSYPVRYRKKPDGWVVLEGVVDGGSNAFDTLILTLDSGYRPDKTLFRSVTSNSGDLAQVTVGTDGTIKVRIATSGDWLSFDGLTFYTGT